jgi:hypothetical protein
MDGSGATPSATPSMPEPLASGMVIHEVALADDQTIRIVSPPVDTPAAAIVRELAVGSGRAVILIIGGAGSFDRDIARDNALRSRLLQMFGRGFMLAAADAGAVFVDGGTDAGVMALLGEAVRDQPESLSLIGVAPAGRVIAPGDPAGAGNGIPFEPHHSHLVLVDAASWGGETPIMIEVTAELARSRPVVVILVHGGDGAQDELVRVVRRGWPIVVVEGFGGLADQIASLRETPGASSPDPKFAEVLADGHLIAFPVTEPPAAFGRLIASQLGNGATLRRANELRNLYAHNARRQQSRFSQLQKGILILAVIGAILVVLQNMAEPLKPPDDGMSESATVTIWGRTVFFADALRFLLVFVPVVSTIMLSASVRFNAGVSWLALRSSAEAIKAEIFRYRCRVGAYGDWARTGNSREQVLARKLESINRQLMQTPVSLSDLREPPGDEGDDFVSRLTPDTYLHERLENQKAYYRQEIKDRHGKLWHFQMMIWVAGGLGTLLAFLGQEAWVVVMAALAVVLAAYLQYVNAEMSLVMYNRAAFELTNIATWWSALSAAERRDARYFETLVASTEAILAAEHAAWLQQTEDAITSFLHQQAQGKAGIPQATRPGKDSLADAGSIAGAPADGEQETEKGVPDASRANSAPGHRALYPLDHVAGSGSQ